MRLSDIKITPLSIVVAICVFYAGFFLFGNNESPLSGANLKVLYTLILAIVLFITDVLFRRMVPDRKWVWIIQTSFIVLIVAMILIFKKI
ncbi:hypothetical protein Pedsa_1708 [Pseudopedobacter saltans DSM 12145]|uniref:Uncharacterized protein n=1 Tax=Pseudopedobacter saltans (strain ATCC 51119 / DSM 12145 / JCM 21818 / CCUG 39354 / LMG 10337 / NBRC 100064 / NCIMB 13643) TaxID=762903 RepID=F0S7K5_PSESL|nr:hypothetical protein Pedsa_1708 [Pseudopedobacter saltans DSM 12145]